MKLFISKSILIYLFILFLVTPVLADWKNIPGQLTVDILQAPTPLVAQDKYYLVYELNLTNHHHAPIT